MYENSQQRLQSLMHDIADEHSKVLENAKLPRERLYTFGAEVCSLLEPTVDDPMADDVIARAHVEGNNGEATQVSMLLGDQNVTFTVDNFGRLAMVASDADGNMDSFTGAQGERIGLASLMRIDVTDHSIDSRTALVFGAGQSAAPRTIETWTFLEILLQRSLDRNSKFRRDIEERATGNPPGGTASSPSSG